MEDAAAAQFLSHDQVQSRLHKSMQLWVAAVLAASPDEGDIHGYPQWDASQAWKSELLRGPFISEWGTHAMPTRARKACNGR